MRHLPALIFTAFALSAQPPAFEVATIRTNHTGSLVSNEERIQGPGWIASDRFDVVAKSPDGVPDSELGPMLQALLKDRFGLVLHPETREVPAWVLVVGKGGPKIHAFDPARPPVPPANVGQSVIVGAGTMAQLAGMLENPSGRHVVDKTGLEGRFSYVLSYMRLASQPAATRAATLPPTFSRQPRNSWVSGSTRAKSRSSSSSSIAPGVCPPKTDTRNPRNFPGR
jgi:hypothetical protein